jgi:hypothetical protein
LSIDVEDVAFGHEMTARVFKTTARIPRTTARASKNDVRDLKIAAHEARRTAFSIKITVRGAMANACESEGTALEGRRAARFFRTAACGPEKTAWRSRHRLLPGSGESLQVTEAPLCKRELLRSIPPFDLAFAGEGGGSIRKTLLVEQLHGGRLCRGSAAVAAAVFGKATVQVVGGSDVNPAIVQE